MTADPLPVLLVVVPLVAAPLCVLVGRLRLAYPLALAATWAAFAIAGSLLVRTAAGDEVLLYSLGGWAPPLGIEYRVDVLAAFVATFVSGVGAVALGWAPATLEREIPPASRPAFLAAYLLCLAGLLGIVVTADLFNLFVFLEISSISSYTLIGMGGDRRALTAAFQYLIMGTIGATFVLIGVGLLYMMTGTLNMADVAARLPQVADTRTVIAAFGFLTVGLALKMALFPLHAWLPNAYTFAPSVVSAFLAASATKVSVYALLRITFGVLAPSVREVSHLTVILLPLALTGIFVTSIVAVFQRDLKRLLAYSSVAQIGYMALGIGFLTTGGLTAAILHMFNHAMMKGALFLAAGAMVLRIGSSRLEDLRGVGRRMPLTTAAWVAGGLALVGVPPTAGFVSKWYLIRAAIEAGVWPVAALVLVSSLVALLYVWRVVETAYFRAPEAGAPPVAEAPWPMLAGTWLLVGVTLCFGVWGTPVVLLAQRAAETLLPGAGP